MGWWRQMGDRDNQAQNPPAGARVFTPTSEDPEIQPELPFFEREADSTVEQRFRTAEGL